MMLVFGDIRQMRKVAERAHNLAGLLARQVAQQCGEFLSGTTVIAPMMTNGELADAFHGAKDIRTFLIAHGFAQQAAQ
jgi:hypothetical protein